MWQSGVDNCKNFPYGKDDNEKAAETARTCGFFKQDCEDELVSDEPVSCYNCRYRRWTQNSFECMKR